MKELLKYIEEGISINGNPIDGYTVFTIPTQHFRISSLEKLTVSKFEEMIEKHRNYREEADELLRLSMKRLE